MVTTPQPIYQLISQASVIFWGRNVHFHANLLTIELEKILEINAQGQKTSYHLKAVVSFVIKHSSENQIYL